MYSALTVLNKVIILITQKKQQQQQQQHSKDVFASMVTSQKLSTSAIFGKMALELYDVQTIFY